MKYLILDFETKDPYISLGLGAGWAFALNVPTHLFKVLGYSTAIYDTESDQISELRYYTLAGTYKELIPGISTDELMLAMLEVQLVNCDALIAHNITYELGCLRYLGIHKEVIDKLTIFDTVTMSKLYDNTLPGYSLEILSKLFLKEDQGKNTDLLIDKVIELKLVEPPKREGYNIDNYRRKCRQFAYQNLDILQEKSPETVAEYCNADIVATGQLFKYLLEHGLDIEQAKYWSDIQKACVSIRALGNRVCLKAINSGITSMAPEVMRLRSQFYKIYGDNYRRLFGVDNMVNYDLDSPKQLAEALIQLGYDLPKTKKGGISTNKDWLEENLHDPILASIHEYRSAKLIYKDFFLKIKDMQQYSCPEALVDGARYGRIFPEYNLFGATKSGRFTGSNPNMQQIPRKHPKWGHLIRSIFVPNTDGDYFFSADWEQQEPRLQIYYASLIGAPGAKEMVSKYQKNPNIDIHQIVADLASITRAEAKPINLGMSFAMGPGRLARELKLPTKLIRKYGKEIETAGEEATDIIKRYHAAVPYIKYLQDEAKKQLVKKGYILTLDKRKLKRGFDGKDYKGISKLIQGSGADMMYKALMACYYADIKVLAVIHDEICFEGKDKDAEKVREIMCNTHETLTVPMLVDMKSGKSWGELQ